MVKTIYVLMVCASWYVVFTTGCTSDMVAPPEPCEVVGTYDDGVRDIIQSSCNLSGCHDGSSGVGNYESYEGIRGVLENGKFRQTVIVEKTMPKSGELTDEEFELLRCWSGNGFPEN